MAMTNAQKFNQGGMANQLAGSVATAIDGAVAAKTEVAALTAIATADATDPATTQALVNECKAKINSIIAALKA